MVVVGLVAEGWHDYLMLQPLVEQELRKRTAEQLIFKHLQPIQDATGAYERGGWSRVLAWCQSNAGALLDTYFTPLFASDPACDIIVIHVDGDSLEHMGPHTALAIPAAPVSVEERVTAVTAIVVDWLQPSADQRQKLAFAVPVLHTEAWILCSEGNSSCEAVDAKTLFRAAYVKRRHGKLAGFYAARSRAARASEVSKRAVSYNRFADEIASTAF